MLNFGFKITAFIATHRFSLEIATIGIGGLTAQEWVAADHLGKVIVSVITSVILILKYLKDRKKTSV